MSYKWPDKDKDELLDYSIDWSRFLSSSTLAGNDTIGSVDWYIYDADGTKTEVSDSQVVDGLQFVTGTIDEETDTIATIRLSLGTNNKRYKIACRITTGSNLKYERSVFIRIKEK
jgi:hypothetical protein